MSETTTKPVPTAGATPTKALPAFLEKENTVSNPATTQAKPKAANPLRPSQRLLGTTADQIQDNMEPLGDPQNHLERVAKIWSGLLGIEVLPSTVAILMSGERLARAAFDPENPRTFSGVAGWAALGAEAEQG